MSAPPTVSGRPNEAITSRPLSTAAAGELKNEVVRITAADVLPPGSLQPPTAQTFDELEIPVSFRAAVDKALTANEKMLWVGRPSRNRQVHPRNAMPPAVGIGLMGLAGIILVAVLGSAVIALQLSPGHVFGCVAAAVLGLIGSAIVFLPKLNKPEKWCRYCYVVTNRRALLVEQTVTGVSAQTYLPHELVGLERRDHAEVAGAGDLVFEYIMTLGNTFNAKTGAFLQQGPTGPSHNPQRVPRGFVCLDQVREVEDLIRMALLQQLEQAMDNGALCEASCACGVTLEAPAAVAGKSVKCPRCTAIVGMPARRVDDGVAITCREDGAVPAELKEKLLAGLDRSERPVWIGQPIPRLVLLRGGVYLAISGLGILVALMWLALTLVPAQPAAPQPQPQPGKKVAAPAATANPLRNPLPPIALLIVSACVSAVPLVHRWLATRTCYAITTRRALVYKKGLFGPTRESYSPLEVSAMRRSNSWLAAGSGDLIFRTVHVITHVRKPGMWNNNIRTVHYGLLAIPHLDEVEKLLRETLVDRFVDKLNQASALG
jgi:hypothetical protein